MSKQDIEEFVETGHDSDTEQRTVQYLLTTPAYMSATMRRQLLQEMLKKLPKPAQDRVTALKNLQLKHLQLEAKFYEEVYNLETKYQLLYQPLLDKRSTIIKGEYEPSGEEIEWAGDEEEELSAKLKDASIEIRNNLKVEYPADLKGVPDFWLTIFRSTELLSGMMQEQDEPVLKQLLDVKVVYGETPMTYTIEFHFAPNDYFTDLVLTKQYFLKSKVDGEHPFAFEGPEIYKCIGCDINWNKGKNLTVKTIHKKQKHKARGAVRTITKQVPTESFFNFFNPPLVEEGDTGDVDALNILGADYEIGHFLRARIVPKAVLYYTGDVVDDDDEYDEEEEEEEEDYEEEDSDEDEPVPQKSSKKGGGGGGSAAKANPPECQTQ